MPLNSRSLFRSLGATLLVGTFGLGLSGCATTATVKVDAMANPNAPGGFAYTLSGNKSNHPTGDSRYDDVAAHVRTALSSRGMYEAPNAADADVVIDFEYGEHAPQTHVSTVQEPVQVAPGQPMPQIGNGTMQSGPSITIGPGSGQNNVNYPTVNNTGQIQTVMVEKTRVTQTTEKYIRISARENPAAKNRPKGATPQQVWTVEATLEDENSDFPKALPAMIDAAIDYIGVNTGGQQKVTVKVDS